ncbi:MAG: HmuY family protein [Bdellovibrionota bacterium]
MKAHLAVLGLFFASSVASAALIEKTVELSSPAVKPEQTMWLGLDFSTGKIIENVKWNDPKSPKWDIRSAASYFATNRAKVWFLNTRAFETVKEAPSNANYETDSEFDPDGLFGPRKKGFYNKPLTECCNYDMLAGHLRVPKPHVMVIQTADNHFAKLQVVQYVRKGKGAKMSHDEDGEIFQDSRGDDGKTHVLIRYKYNTVAGDRKLE